MKKVKKLVAFMLAAVMVLAMGITSMAATGTITINNATAGNTYKVYKVFDAVGNGTDTSTGTNISYKLVSGKTKAPAGFSVDTAGNVTYTGSGVNGVLTADDIAAIAAYVTEDDLVDTVTIAEGAISGTTKALDNGYYYITTTTGTAVTVTSTNPNAVVVDKNEAPKLDKSITGVGDGSLDTAGQKALAQVGTDVDYEATIEVKTGAKGYVFHDKMGDGLAYNDDVTITIDDETEEIEAGTGTYSKVVATGDDITITFVDEWIKAQVGKTIRISYSAKVTSDALTTKPAENTASIDYGDNSQNVVYLPDGDIPEVYNATITVTKVDGNQAPLAGAGFVLKNGDGKYYKKTVTEGKASISWVEDIDDADELKTVEGENGNIVKFTGLANGTYTLVEKTVPAGYNKAEDKTFTILENNYEAGNLSQSAIVTNNAGSLLPSTGGMGTTIFYILGGILVIGAAVLLVTRRRMRSME